MEISLTDHLAGAGQSVQFDASARSRLSSRIAHKLRKVSDLQRRSGEVLSAGRCATVLIQDQEATYALEPWSNWQFEHGLLAAMGRLATLAESSKQGSAELLGCVTEAVLQGSLAPFAGCDLHAGEGRHDLRSFSSSELQDEYRHVLDIAAGGEPVVISRWNKPVSVLESFGLRNRESEFVRHADDAFRFRVSERFAADRGMPVESWVPVSAYPWLSVLPPDAIAEFSEEAVPALLEALRQNDPEVFVLTLKAWEASCEARGDAELMRALKGAAAAVSGTPIRLKSFTA